ncbi:MAG: ComF family protein [Candidatus Cloacimonetes bacterium]|nr:ComF family protein [Candidatus Cloacimonadota bacterium]
MNILKTFRGLFFPATCFNCQNHLMADERIICADCNSSLNFLEDICLNCGASENKGECRICSTNTFHFDRARSVFLFTPILQKLIHEFKYHEITKIANLFGELSQTYLKKFQPFDIVDYIAPVPLHKVKKRDRGFNQSELLTGEISKNMNWEHLPNLIKRKRFTKTQTKLNKEQRRKNVSSAFKINPKFDIKGKNILLVDDVFTTGATTNSIAEVLKESQADKVYVLTIGRAL